MLFNSKNALLLTIVFFITLMISCNKIETPTNSESKPESILFFPDSLEIDDSSIIATLTIYKSTVYNNDVNHFINYSGSDAAFYNSTHSVWAGNISLNGINVPSYSTFDSTQNILLYAYGEQPYQSIFDGRQYNWIIPGSNDFSAFNVSLNAPSYVVSFSNLIPNQNVSKSSNLVINWNNSPNASAGIKVMLTQANVGTSLEIPVDNGTCTITSDKLAQFSNGSATLTIFSGNGKVVPLGSMNAIALIYSSYEIPVNINN